ncbi:hypothetical protein Q73A0000_11250 [Kaistella flava (ex Peng et al. 2021)]|uniref:Uncharacterized protein n=1 Tax=Kaistella flava (ex Peng et al. 2021) TaxID=2038776 RepID=A0A7M2YBS6_9FLAO|nr:hypothetical protein [Kaistella flava (ex Peng et al. 2021)]QOW10892.1 hypothetical protein Q73A0000_11250 [Kaistella flava (ex Peng et al. 2021)]
MNTISKFNDECFSIRKPHQHYDIYRFVQNPFASTEKDFIYSVEKDRQYVAQMLTMPVPLSLNEEIIPAFWGQDYFVLEENRGEGIGKELANYYLGRDYYIAVGFSAKSAIIHQKMGAKKIGYLSFYIKWASPISKLKFLIWRGFKVKVKAVTSYQLPNKVGQFKKINRSSELELPQLNWNENVIESLRNRDYFNWRFFYKSKPYSVYQSEKTTEGNAAYFVVKPHFYRGVNWLQVVDYRFNNLDIVQFYSILKSVEALRKKMNLFGVLITSTQKISNDLLNKKKFERYKNEVVLTTYPFEHQETDAEHNHFIISFSDSDLDMHNYLGRFYYDEGYV